MGRGDRGKKRWKHDRIRAKHAREKRASETKGAERKAGASAS